MEALITLVSVVAGQWIKDRVYEVYGMAGVHAVVFAVAFAGAIVWYVAINNQGVMEALKVAFQVLLMGVGFYEVVMKRLGFKKAEEKMVERHKKELSGI